MNDFVKKLAGAWRANNSLLCVGLDPDLKRLPAPLVGRADAITQFCRVVVDATADLVCAFKPQIAYFHAERAEGQLEDLIAYIHERHPAIPVILDAKRGDIGSTAEQYAREAFERYQADAVTVSPFLVATLGPGERERLVSRCAFIAANGSGFNICSTCRLGSFSFFPR